MERVSRRKAAWRRWFRTYIAGHAKGEEDDEEKEKGKGKELWPPDKAFPLRRPSYFNSRNLVNNSEVSVDHALLSANTSTSAVVYVECAKDCIAYCEGSMESTPPNFNMFQCKYLLNKLKVTIQDADLILEVHKGRFAYLKSPLPLKDMTECLGIFADLYALAEDVKCFIMRCCENTWIQSAIMFANESEYVFSLGFNLELYQITLKCKVPRRNSTTHKVASLWDPEFETVKAMVLSDKEVLMKKLKDYIQIGPTNIVEHELATYLLLRLEKKGKNPTLDLPSSSHSSHTSGQFIKGVRKLEILKKGEFGTVHKATWLGIEVITKTFFEPDDADFRNEVFSFASLSHPNIVSLFGCTKHKRKCSIVMEKMDIDLHTMLVNSENQLMLKSGFILEAIDIMQQVAQGVDYLHEMGIMHKDLKSQNILVRFVQFGHVQIKVADFGLWRTKEKKMMSTNHTPHLGINRWMATELGSEGENDVHQVNYELKNDVYSFGMICYEILIGPNRTMMSNERRKNILNSELPECPKELKILIEKCWSSEPSEHPNFGDICAQLRHLKCVLMMTYTWTKKMSFELWSKELPSKCLLGKGQAGIVYETTWMGGKFARKDFVGVPSEIFVKEANVLIGLQNHKNIVKTYGWTVDKGNCSLVLEYMDDDLLSLLQKRKESKQNMAGKGSSAQFELSLNQPFELLESLHIMLQIATGVKHLHKQGIIHGDLKTKNVLVIYTNNGDELECVKVADYGLVDTKEKNMFFVSHQARINEMVKWKAPEYMRLYWSQLMEDEDESPKSNLDLQRENNSSSFSIIATDVYSFALICFQILTGNDPYPNMNWKELMDKIESSHKRPNLPDDCPLSLQYLLKSCWHALASKRPISFSEICDRLEQIKYDVATGSNVNEPEY